MVLSDKTVSVREVGLCVQNNDQFIAIFGIFLLHLLPLTTPSPSPVPWSLERETEKGAQTDGRNALRDGGSGVVACSRASFRPTDRPTDHGPRFEKGVPVKR